ncbi:site-specific DNA-methyltransferase [Peribacillus sp. 1P06PB]|uniref:DNA methyltransferase n=1 Tax=Peribacillus sp. 1P06PB TaxID=3132296 RepID=UPI00399F92E7
MSTNEQDINVEQYEFEPIKGYPMLNWKGKRPFRSTQFYPAQLKETHREAVDGWVNKIFWGDNLQVMSHLLKEYRGRINLVYIDPPFDSKADYKKKINLKGESVINDHNAFEEKQYTDIWTNDEYLQFIYERLILLKELLTEDGSIYLHCDWHKSHYIRIMMDEIFGVDNFLNEIVWKRSGVHASKKGFGPVHDTILYYKKGTEFVWNKQYVPYEKEYEESWFNKIDEDGRRYGLVVCSAPGERKGTLAHYEWKGHFPPVGRHWAYIKEKMIELEIAGLLEHSRNGVPYVRKYLDESPGVPANDIWTDTGHIKSKSFENYNYPTQKPEKLIKRIIEASSNPGGIVFDCFMGSGTTQAVAMKLGRRFLGSDINLGAIQTTTKRLIKILNENEENIPGFEVYNVNNYDIFRNPVQAKELLIEALEIQPIYNNILYDGEKDGRLVKIMPVNRIATRSDLNELITNFDYKLFERRQMESPTQPVERLLLVCMGHEPDLAAALEQEVGFKLDIEVVDILRDKSNLEFKRDSEADVIVDRGKLIIRNFYPMNLLQKLSIMKENVGYWEELVESVMIDWNYDGAVLEPTVVDIPAKNELVTGIYEIPEDAGTIRVKITDLLSESFEVSIDNG